MIPGLTSKEAEVSPCHTVSCGALNSLSLRRFFLFFSEETQCGTRGRYETRNLDLNFSFIANYSNLASHFLNLKDERIKLGDSEDSSFSKMSDSVNNSCLRMSIKFKSAPKSLQPSRKQLRPEHHLGLRNPRPNPPGAAFQTVSNRSV